MDSMKQARMISTTQTERHFGADLLRTVSMFMILILHILGSGGVLDAVQLGDRNYIPVWFLESLAYCAVNCYALISGYVGIDVRYRYANLIRLWLQVVLYMLLGNLAFAVFKPGSVTIKTIIKGFLPFTKNHYWYFTAYFCMFLFMPLLNRIVKGLTKKQAVVVCTTIFVVFTVLRSLRQKDDVFEIGSGYSVHWLAMLYVVGGCIKKHGFLKNVPDWILLLGYLLCSALTVAAKIFISTTSIVLINGNLRTGILLSYISPTVFLSSVFLLVLCGKHPRLPKGVEKVVSILAPVSFGVYIIHAQPMVYEYFFNQNFAHYATYSVPGMIGAVLLTAVVVYGICGLIDTLRIQLFRMLKLRQRLNRLEERLVGNLWEQTDEAQ